MGADREPTLQEQAEACEIPLANSSRCAIVDATDADEMLRYKWFLDRNGYAMRWQWDRTKQRTGQIMMARQLLGLGGGRVPMVDHIDENPLNNRRSNLRAVNTSINTQRARKRIAAAGFIGVHVVANSSVNSYGARIRIGGKEKWLGSFPLMEMAAKAYDEAARAVYGPHARVNFP